MISIRSGMHLLAASQKEMKKSHLLVFYRQAMNVFSSFLAIAITSQPVSVVCNSIQKSTCMIVLQRVIMTNQEIVFLQPLWAAKTVILGVMMCRSFYQIALNIVTTLRMVLTMNQPKTKTIRQNNQGILGFVSFNFFTFVMSFVVYSETRHVFNKCHKCNSHFSSKEDSDANSSEQESSDEDGSGSEEHDSEEEEADNDKLPDRKRKSSRDAHDDTVHSRFRSRSPLEKRGSYNFTLLLRTNEAVL